MRVAPRNWVSFLWGCWSVAAGCANASADNDAARWLRVTRDANYDISIDTSRTTRRSQNSYVVWYRTDHTLPHQRNGKAFNREIVQSLVRCDSLQFKVISVDMSFGGDKPISQQRTAPRELADQPWRRVERGTAEEIAAQAGCTFAARRYPAKPR